MLLWHCMIAHLPCLRRTGRCTCTCTCTVVRDRMNTIAIHVSLCLKLTRNSSKCPEKCLKGYEKQLKEFKKLLKPVFGSRTFKLSIRTWGTNISEGVQIFQAVSEIFVPGGTNIFGVQILRDNPQCERCLSYFCCESGNIFSETSIVT